MSDPTSSVRPEPAGEQLEAFRAEVATFLDASIADGVACPAFGAIMPPGRYDEASAWQRHCHKHGFAGIHWPTEYGGRGLTPEHNQVWNVECARRGIAAYMNFQGFVLAGGAILRFGTPEQKARFLEPTLAADILWCQLFSEPDAGSDLASLSARAEPDGDSGGWRVSGQKVWSSTAQLAQWAILMARTDQSTPGSGGISFFLFDMDSLGVEVRPIKQMTGDSEFCEVFLDDAPLPPDALLGPLGGGWNVAMSVLADERSAAAAAGIGLRRELAALRAAIDPIDPMARDRAMDLTVRGEALAHLLDRSAGDPRLGPLTKLGRTEIGIGLSAALLEANGPAAMVWNDTTAAEVEAFLYAPGMRLGGGTSEIQRNLIGERLLGLPREPKARQ